MSYTKTSQNRNQRYVHSTLIAMCEHRILHQNVVSSRQATVHHILSAFAHRIVISLRSNNYPSFVESKPAFYQHLEHSRPYPTHSKSNGRADAKYRIKNLNLKLHQQRSCAQSSNDLPNTLTGLKDSQKTSQPVRVHVPKQSPRCH